MRLYDLESKFTTEEFTCPCQCGFGSKPEDIDRTLIDKLNLIRILIGRPLIVTSGARCAAYNASIGGKPFSAHLSHAETKQCRAADIAVRTGHDRIELIQVALAVGFTRLGIGANFLHLDVAWDLPTPVMWVYKEA